MCSSSASGVVLAVLSLLSTPAASSGPAMAATVDPEAIDSYLREQVARRRLPGLAVAVVEGDRVVMVRGYGSAGGGRAVTPQTQFYIGSCTKSFTALAVMQLVERGRLELDGPVRQYLPWFKVADDEATAAITVRHLLNQTSGLSEAGDPQPHLVPASLTDAVRALGGVRPTAPVGARFQYYNGNYRTLGLLLEKTSGRPYAQYLRDEVLQPLAMTRTVADPVAAPGLAQGHARVFGFAFPRPQAFEPGALPSGYLISTAEDLAHYLIALLDGGQYGRRRVLQPPTLAEMLTPPQADAARAAPPATVARVLDSQGVITAGYGMGWFVAESAGGGRLVAHGGSLEHFQANLALFPGERRGLAVLVNQNSVVGQLVDETPLWTGLACLLRGRTPPAPSRRTWIPLLFGAVVATDLGISLLRLGRLRRWKRTVASRGRLQRWSRALVDLVLPLVFLLGFPSLVGLLVRTDVTWAGLLVFPVPEVALWLIASALLTLARGVAKTILLARMAEAPSPLAR